MLTQTQIEKYKKDLGELYSHPDFLQITKLEDGLTNEEMILKIVELPLNEYDHIKKMSVEFNEKIPVEYLADKYISPIYVNPQSSPFLQTYGLSSNQTIVSKVPKILKYFKESFIEFEIYNFNNENACDLISNINVTLLDFNDYDFVECVLKIDNHVICSQILQTNQVKHLLYFPNTIVVNNSMCSNNISIAVRCYSSYLNSLSKAHFTIQYDIIFLETHSKRQIGDFFNHQGYFFLTATGIIIFGIHGKYGIRFFTQLLDTIHPFFKSLYGAFQETKEDKETINYENISIAI
jgi:hypothetical protein